MRAQYFYLLELSYLGYKYHGYAIQPQHKTIQGQLEKTLRWVLGKDVPFKTLGCSRTDARVSARQFITELFLETPLTNPDEFLQNMGLNLPQDIAITNLREVNAQFNVINDVIEKTYSYTFSAHKEYHPFNAPYLMQFREKLDIARMQEAAKFFEGTHNFSLFQVSKKVVTKPIRHVRFCAIEPYPTENLPVPSQHEVYRLHVKSQGFMRYQIRLMMGFLVEIGRGERDLSDIPLALKAQTNIKGIYFITPGHALVLEQVSYHE